MRDRALGHGISVWKMLYLVTGIVLVSLWSLNIVSACDEECAMQVANREVSGLGLDLDTVEVMVDGENKRWERFMVYTMKSPDEGSRRLYEEYNAKLQGKNFWVIYYSLKPIEGRYHKGGGATALIDKGTGAPLLIIRGE